MILAVNQGSNFTHGEQLDFLVLGFHAASSRHNDNCAKFDWFPLP